MIRSISPRSVWEHSRARAGRWVLYSVVERAQFSAVGLAVLQRGTCHISQAVVRKKAICHGELVRDSPALCLVVCYRVANNFWFGSWLTCHERSNRGLETVVASRWRSRQGERLSLPCVSASCAERGLLVWGTRVMDKFACIHMYKVFF